MRVAIWILCGFAALWGYSAVGSLGLPIWCAIFPLGISLLIAFLARNLTWEKRSMPAGSSRRIGRLIGLWIFIEVVLMLLSSYYLPKLGLAYAIVPAVTIIVGLHFIPLAYYIPAPIYYRTAAAMTLAGLIALAFPEPQAVQIASAASAIILWLTAAALLKRPA